MFKDGKHFEGVMPGPQTLEGLTGSPRMPGQKADGGYEDDGGGIREQENPLYPNNHGFPQNPIDLLEQKLNEYEEMERKEDARWKSLTHEEREQEKKAKQMKEAKERGPGEPDTLLELPLEDKEPPMTYKELTSPLTREELKKVREKKGKSLGAHSRMPKLNPEVHVFVLGGHDYVPESGDPYDDSEDRERYTQIMNDVFNGDAILLLEKVESIMRSSKFKIFLKIARM